MKRTKPAKKSILRKESDEPPSQVLARFKTFSDKHFPSALNIERYRKLYSDSFSDQLKHLTYKCNSSDEIMDSLIPLALYYLNCNLPFIQLIEMIDSKILDIPTPVDLVHILFQNSEKLLRAIILNHYSFCNPIPFYYPIIKAYSKKDSVEYTICHELWYSLNPHNAVVSFGLGIAANDPIGKSTLLDLIFELNFTPNSTINSCFHAGSIDLRLTKNFFSSVTCDVNLVNWAFFDFHAPTNFEMVKILLKQVSIVLIHIYEKELIENFKNIENSLKSFELKGKHVYIFVRDASEENHEESLDENIYTVIKVPEVPSMLKDNDIRELGKLKFIGKEIIELNAKIPKFTSRNLEQILKEFNPSLHQEIMSKQSFLTAVTDSIVKTRKNSDLNFEFLNFYPTFVKLMKKKYEILSENNIEKLEELNTQCSKCFSILNESKICPVVGDIFQNIISHADSVLILWKLAQDLQILTNELSTKDELNEQANDKYSIEILWREAILSQKYFHKNNIGSGNRYHETLSRSLSSFIQTGEPFELIDGDNLVFFSRELNSMFRYFHVWLTSFARRYNTNNPDNPITEAPLVLSIIGPQSSGKSTLLNYVFGCKFLTSTGRCTRGVYGSLLELNKPINKSKFLLVLDTEGIDSVERSSAIHFDRTLIVFCLSVSNIVIINLIGELNNEMQELMKICAYSLNHLKVHRTTMPKLVFVLNQIADPNLDNRRTALKLLINRLDQNLDHDKKSKNANVSDLIQLTEDDLFTLPPAFDIAVVDIPGQELFNKGVIKQHPALNFALKCSLLRVAIFEKLQNNTSEERPSFTSMSEWLEMAGETWKTIIKFQDIVKFRNFNELHLHRDLKVLVNKLMQEHFYIKKKEISKKIAAFSDEILEMTTKTSADLMDQIDRKIQIFEDYFSNLSTRCILEFRTGAEDFPESQLIHREHLEQLSRLITTEKLDYIITLKTRTHIIYNHRKRLECFENFKKTVTNNISGYLTMGQKGHEDEFEKLWKEAFQDDNLDELYRDQNLNDFYLMFSSGWDLIPYTEVFEKYKTCGFNLTNVENTLQNTLVKNLSRDTQDEEPYFYPTKKSFPLKDIQCHFYSNKLEYLTEDKFYYLHSTEGQESRFIKYFPNSKAIYKRDWVPEECIPLLQSCSGYYPEHDINWKEVCPSKQITRLVTSLIRPDSYNTTRNIPYSYRRILGYSHIPKFLQDIIEDVSPFFKREITPVTIQHIADALDKRLAIFNHEISFIGAELTIHARRSIGTLVFSKAFTSYYTKKWCVFTSNRKQLSNEKDDLKKYFVNKVEISKIIQFNVESVDSAKSDSDVAQKCANSYSESLRYEMRYGLSSRFDEQLSSNKELFDYDSISEEAQKIISKALNDDAPVRGHDNFVVKYYCQRNEALGEIFEKRWEKFFSEISNDIVRETTENQQNEVSIVLDKLSSILQCLEIVEDKSKFNSANFFKPCEEQPKDCDEFQLNESSYRSMTLFLKYAMNPSYNVEYVKKFFTDGFECNNIKMKLESDILLQENVLQSLNTGVIYELLQENKFFNSELLFNIYSFLKSLRNDIQRIKINITVGELRDKTTYTKLNQSKSSLGCPRQCPCCGKFCDWNIHGQVRCHSSGHQFPSMGGKVWANDKHHSAVFLRCEDYTDEMYVALPGRLIKWKEFKRVTERAWDWQSDTEISKSEKTKRRVRLIKIWDKFGKGILEHHRLHSGARIAFRPYEEESASLDSGNITKYQICFVIDGTGSMGRDIENVRISVQNLVNSYKKTNKTIVFRVIIYRDHCDEKLIETYPTDKEFLPKYEGIAKFLDDVIPEGGGDVPEASLDGLAVALTSNWDRQPQTKRMLIHSFDAPPHGNFPHYQIHNTNSNPDHCCCCSSKCHFDWQKDVWKKIRDLEIEYHGINTGDSTWLEFESTMRKELDYLCKGFTKCGKDEVNYAVMQQIINYQGEVDEDSILYEFPDLEMFELPDGLKS